MKYIVVKNGKVVNVILASRPEEVYPSEEFSFFHASDFPEVCTGFLYEDNEFRAPEPIEIEEPKMLPQVSQAQARLYMLQAGILDQVESLLKDNKEAQIIWEYAEAIKRDNQLITFVGEQLNLSEEQLDNMFLEASQIVV